MKEKIKNKLKTFFKCYLPGFILGLISASIITVYAETYFPSLNTTYDNTNTELKSENVQDAIDELYGVCFPKSAGDQIIEDAGLEKDPYECRYFFTGANPNNYITFNGEEAGWRIISVECDGTIKIMKNSDIGIEGTTNQYWDVAVNSNWARPASLNTYLNSTYYNELNNTAQSQIVIRNWSIGKVTLNNNMQAQINDENSLTWEGKIALPTLSEYVRTNSNINRCGTSLSHNDNPSFCSSTNWMAIASNIQGDWWTISPYSDNSVFSISGGGDILASYIANINGVYATRPALYVSSEVTLTGSGTMQDPYVVS